MWSSKVLVIFLVFVVSTMSKPISVEDQWKEFKSKNGKEYDSEEEQKRFIIFQDNLKKIGEHNKKYEKGEVTYKMGVNQFADLTHEEFKKYLGFRKPQQNDENLITAI